jgi:hypothetical protein
VLEAVEMDLFDPCQLVDRRHRGKDLGGMRVTDGSMMPCGLATVRDRGRADIPAGLVARAP